MENFHILKVSTLGPTNTLPARVSIKSERFRQSIVIHFDNEPGDAAPTMSTAERWLIKNGFNLIGKGEGRECYYLISTTFEPLKK